MTLGSSVFTAAQTTCRARHVAGPQFDVGIRILYKGGTFSLPMPTSTPCDLALFAYLLDAEPGPAEPSPVRRCPIVNKPLGVDAVHLPCGHAFSYGALVQEIQSQRQRAKQSGRGKHAFPSWSCPYCRARVDKILPYNPICLPCSVHGVNAPAKHRLVAHTCQHNGRAGQQCGREAFRLKEGGPCLCKAHHLYGMRAELKMTKEDLAQMAVACGIDVARADFPCTKSGMALLILARRTR